MKTSILFINSVRSIFFLITLLAVSGCLVSEESQDLFTEKNAEACKSARPFAFDGIGLDFAIPNDALDFRLVRDGSPVFRTSDRSVTTFSESNLTPGQTYRYRCEAIVDRDNGFQQVGKELKVTLPSSIPPKFDGLKNATLQGNDQAYLDWDLISDSILSHFKVFKVVGTASSNSEFPKSETQKINNMFAANTLISNLGDELTYSFRVSACNTSDVCDNNNSILSITTPDTGAPKTNGATDIALENGKVVLTAPWSDTDGAIERRIIYSANVAGGASCPASFSSYSELKSVVVINKRNTPTRLEDTRNLIEDSKYCYVVRDQDPSGNIETNFNHQEVTIGDNTAPSFTATISLDRDPTDNNTYETRLVARWNAMKNESQDSKLGASEYIVYLSSVTAGDPDADPCATGVKYTTIPAATYDEGDTVEVMISGLQARSSNRICVKAKDSAKNISSQSPKAFETTGDRTAPSFSGIQRAEYVPATSSVDVEFVVPAANDIRRYAVTGEVEKPDSSITTFGPIYKTLPPKSPGSLDSVPVTIGSIAATDGDRVRVAVNVCDNAGLESFNDNDNCSTTTNTEELLIPDTNPPQGFLGVSDVQPGPTNSSVIVSWLNPSTGSWADYVGFKLYYVNDSDELVEVNSGTSCVCTSNDCVTNPINSCTVEGGAALSPSKEYEFYVAAYDSVGNETSLYIPFTGGSRITKLARPADVDEPDFNASLQASEGAGGVSLEFNSASDNQDSSLDITYEIYRKEGATFFCPAQPFTSAGGCDGLSPYHQDIDSSFPIGSTRDKVFADSSVMDGVNYFYQICAVDFASNRKCQPGIIASVTVSDSIGPEVINVASDKRADGSGSWTITFNATDNVTNPESLVIQVYKQATPFTEPLTRPAGSGDISGAAITIDASGNASFTDTGTPDVTSVYYLIAVRDLKGNWGYASLADMPEGVIIDSITWSDPLSTGQPRFEYLVGDITVTIEGKNFDSIVDIRSKKHPRDDVGILTGQYGTGFYSRVCLHNSLKSLTPTKIVCKLGGNEYTSPLPYTTTPWNIYFWDSLGRYKVVDAGKPPFDSYCEWANMNGITDLKGAGTSSNPFVLCTPEHITKIGTSGPDGDFTSGHFVLGADIDMTSVVGFEGVPEVVAGQFFLDGRNYTISNLTIDTSSTNEDAALFKKCTGAATDPLVKMMIQNLNVSNFTIRSGDGKAATLFAEKSCSYPLNRRLFFRIDIENSEIHSSNSAGFLSADYLASGEEIKTINVSNSKIYSTRYDTDSGVGGVIGVLNHDSGFNTLFDELRVSGVDFIPESGETFSGSSIGGLIGRINANNIVFKDSISTNVNVTGGLNYIGGFFGLLSYKVGEGPQNSSSIDLKNSSVQGLNIGYSSGEGDYRGGVIGKYEANGGSNLEITESIKMRTSTVMGRDNLGGLVGGSTDSVGTLIDNYEIILDTTIQGRNNVGGAVGLLQNSELALTNAKSTSTPTLFISGDKSIGGFIGKQSGGVLDIQRSYIARANIISYISNTGGIVGVSEGVLKISETAIGENFNLVGNTSVGGLVGLLSPESGSVIDKTFIAASNKDMKYLEGIDFVGGLIGSLLPGAGAGAGIDISTSAVYGAIASPGTNVGAVLGHGHANANFTDIYYRNDNNSSSYLTSDAGEAAGQITGLSTYDINRYHSYINWDVGTASSDWITCYSVYPVYTRYQGLRIFNREGGICIN